MREILQLTPEFKERVWGGKRLLPGSNNPIGEAWVVYEGCRVSGGQWDGQTLGDVAISVGEPLLGSRVIEQTGSRFPLLIKLLHSLEWLSVQVHPDDEQAKRLEGPEFFGKTEAWHILEADEGAQVVYGLDGAWTDEQLRELIDRNDFQRALRRLTVHAGDTLFTPAGCVHAIGPGLFIYEVQQTSDITYRLYDWDRPASAGRELHLDKGLDVIGNCGDAIVTSDEHRDTPLAQLVDCDYFMLEQITGTGPAIELVTDGSSFHALTLTRGTATVVAGNTRVSMRELDSVVLPAGCGDYRLESDGPVTALRSRVC